MDATFTRSVIRYQGTTLLTGRHQKQDVIIARGTIPKNLGLENGTRVGDETIFPASYENMLVWERKLAPKCKLIAINHAGHPAGFGAGNRIVLSQPDLVFLSDQTTLAGWDGIYRGMVRSQVPFWFIQQSIVRELIPEGVDSQRYPGIGHTGGYGPREFLRAGLFAYASLGGYADNVLPIGADADHAIIIGYDEESLQQSLAFNKLAMAEACDYTKFTVDTSHLFDFPVTLSAADERKLQAVFHGRTFEIPNIVLGCPGYRFTFTDEDIRQLGHKYWKACAVHKELYDHAQAICAGRPFDYELSLDETLEPTPPGDLLFYMVMAYEVMGIPAKGIASVGPNIGFIKRHDYEGDVEHELWPQVNACASILDYFGAMLSVHSADGVRAATGKGPGVDAALRTATAGKAELKVADVYQEVLWQVLATSPVKTERELFRESWQRTYEAVRLLALVYERELQNRDVRDVQRFLASSQGRDTLARTYGQDALTVTLATINYGLPVFRLAHRLAKTTDPANPSPYAELFRRFMFLTYRSMRPLIFQVMTHDGWERLARAIEEATLVRLREMGWIKRSEKTC